MGLFHKELRGNGISFILSFVTSRNWPWIRVWLIAESSPPLESTKQTTWKTVEYVSNEYYTSMLPPGNLGWIRELSKNSIRVRILTSNRQIERTASFFLFFLSFQNVFPLFEGQRDGNNKSRDWPFTVLFSLDKGLLNFNDDDCKFVEDPPPRNLLLTLYVLR